MTLGAHLTCVELPYVNHLNVVTFPTGPLFRPLKESSKFSGSGNRRVSGGGVVEFGVSESDDRGAVGRQVAEYLLNETRHCLLLVDVSFPPQLLAFLVKAQFEHSTHVSGREEILNVHQGGFGQPKFERRRSIPPVGELTPFDVLLLLVDAILELTFMVISSGREVVDFGRTPFVGGVVFSNCRCEVRYPGIQTDKGGRLRKGDRYGPNFIQPLFLLLLRKKSFLGWRQRIGNLSNPLPVLHYQRSPHPVGCYGKPKTPILRLFWE